ncbi:uncharacterized protein PAC_00920 [Phialocephala subalpina]|uniref:Uncharacterized protein n=1 Tax=Phialocephala subalpina TaxID=576137 RepID=A0A1L7WE30_9HELO|nr:uncharacterized protein PAC_00920 [Phialocephala subalpina]
MAKNQEWSTLDYSHEQEYEHAQEHQHQQEHPEDEEGDLIIPELKAEASKRPSESWPLSGSSAPPPDYQDPGSYELRLLSSPYAPSPDLEKGIPTTPQLTSRVGSSEPPNSESVQEPPTQASKPKNNRWKLYCLIAFAAIAALASTFGLAALIAYLVDRHETTAQIDSTPENVTSTASEVSTVFSTVPSLTTFSTIFTSVSIEKGVSTSISTSTSTQTLISVSTLVQPSMPTTIVSTQVVNVTETAVLPFVASPAPGVPITGNKPRQLQSLTTSVILVTTTKTT